MTFNLRGSSLPNMLASRQGAGESQEVILSTTPFKDENPSILKLVRCDRKPSIEDISRLLPYQRAL